MGRSEADKAFAVALAEFNALRSEILSHQTTQAALVGIGLTALAVIAGFVVKEGGSDRLLLAIPPIVAVLVLLHAAASYRSMLIGNYIHKRLWPFLETHTGELPSWEQENARRRRRMSAIPKALAIDFPAMTLFIAASCFALASVHSFDPWWWVGCLMTVIAIVVPAGFAFDIRAKARPG